MLIGSIDELTVDQVGLPSPVNGLTRYTDDTVALRRAFARFPSGLAAVSAEVAGVPHILVLSSFTVGVSENPPLVMFAIRKESETWQSLRDAPFVGVSILGAQLAQSVRQLAGSDVPTRLNGVRQTVAASGAIFLDHATTWLECSIQDVHAAGDHEIVVLRVAALRSDFESDPLIWHRSGFTTLASLGEAI